MSAADALAPEIGILDYGMGNRRSVEKALERIGARARLSADPQQLRAAAGLVLPGVGAFAEAMQRLDALGLAELLRERVAAGTPLLGICLGMQVLFESSSELGGAQGIGLLAGRVRALEAGGLKLPHIGWTVARFAKPSRLSDGLPERCAFYHVHSFAAVPDDPDDVLATAEYGETFATAVQRGCVYGVQFHPEKSSAAGLRLLANFARACVEDAAARRAPAPPLAR